MKKIFANLDKRILAAVLSLVVLLSAMLVYNNITTKDNQVVAAEVHMNQIRVLLTTMGSLNTQDIQITGNYSIQGITDPEYSFRNGVLLSEATYRLKVIDGQIGIGKIDPDNSDSDPPFYILGTDIKLYCHDASRDSYITTNNPSYGKRNYNGNMRVYVSDSTFVFINELGVEDYVLGVVPYEMSEQQHIESLKVQAITARTLAYYNLINKGKDAQNHVVDTTSSQTYKGYDPKAVNCRRAVDETSYQILTYFSESFNNVKPYYCQGFDICGGCKRCVVACYYSTSNGGLTETTQNVWSAYLPYYQIKIDLYDTTYANRVYTLSKNNISASNVTKLKAEISSAVASRGYDTNTLQIISINHVTPTYNSQPASLPENERRAYSLTFDLTVKACKNGSDVYETFTQTFTKAKELMRTFIEYTYGSSRSKLPSTRFKVTETATDIVFTTTGNGHAIGMSHNGVYSRAAAGQSHEEILAFYYADTEIKELVYDKYTYLPIPTGEYLDSQRSSFCLLQNSMDGVLKSDVMLRSDAGAIFSSIGSVEKDTEVFILGESDDWFSVSTKGDIQIAGYVLKSSVEIISSEPIDTKDVLKVGTATAELTVRSDPEVNDANIITALPEGSSVLVLDIKDTFYEIFHNGVLAYVQLDSVTLTETPVNAVSRAEVSAYRAPLFSEPDDMSKKIGYLSENAEVEIFSVTEQFAGLMYDGNIAFIKADRLTITDTDYNYEAIFSMAPASISLVSLKNTVVYSEPDSSGTKVGMLGENTLITASSLENNWYRINYNSGIAYVRAESVELYAATQNVSYVELLASKNTYSDAALNDIALRLPKGSSYEIESRIGDIIKIRYNGSFMYMTAANVLLK